VDDLKLLGVDQLRKRLRAITRRQPDEVGKALYAEGLSIQRVSMRRTPVDTGALRGSHVTTEPVFNGRDVSVRVEVGGPAAPYALQVHEDLDAGHKVGQAKFMQSAAYDAKPGMGGRIAKRLADMFAAEGR
jgi:hypothetical protein